MAPEKIENALVSCPGVMEVWSYGDPSRSYMVGVVVPDPQGIQTIAKELGLEGPVADLCKNPRMIKSYISRLDDYGRKHDLNSLERLKNIYMEPVSLVLKGLTTTTFKVVRASCKNHYKDVIEELYKQ